jgi:predicted phosphoribosyltransferase
MTFANRQEAGAALGKLLSQYGDRDDVVVLGLPRGGVPVAYEVAAALHAPLDVLIVRKLGAAEQPEFALGAVASGGVRVMNPEVQPLCIQSSRFRAEIDRQVQHELAEVRRRETMFRGRREPVALRDKTAILVDDGMATGASMTAAVRAARRLDANRIVVAVPVAAPEAMTLLRREADEVVCLSVPDFFRAVGEWYVDFPQTSDAEVVQLLDRAHAHA